jgi:hypothetical protein
MIESGKKSPKITTGYTTINTDKNSKKILLSTKTNNRIYEPGDNAYININTTDSKNKPLSSEVTVAMIKKEGSNSENELSENSLLDAFYSRESESNIGSNSKIHFYKGNLITSQNGNAQFQIKLPSEEGEYKIYTHANSKNHLFGSDSQTSITVIPELIVKNSTAIEYREGDVIEVSSHVEYNGEDPKDFTVSITSNDLNIDKNTQSKTTTNLTTGQQKKITWLTSAKKDREEINYTITVETKGKRATKNYTAKVIQSQSNAEEKNQKKFITQAHTFDIEKSDNLKIYASKTNLVEAKKAFESLQNQSKEKLEVLSNTINLALSSATLLKENKYRIFDFNKTATQENLNKSIKTLYSNSKNQSAILTLLRIESLGHKIDRELIQESIEEIEKKRNNFTLTEARILTLANSELRSTAISDILKIKNKLSKRELIILSTLTKDISKIKSFHSEIEEKALYAQMLLNTRPEENKKIIQRQIEEIGQFNLSSANISTSEKLESLIAILQYNQTLENLSDKYLNLKISINNKTHNLEIIPGKPMAELTIPAEGIRKIEVLNPPEEGININIQTTSTNTDKTQKAISNNIDLKQEIFEIKNGEFYKIKNNEIKAGVQYRIKTTAISRSNKKDIYNALVHIPSNAKIIESQEPINKESSFIKKISNQEKLTITYDFTIDIPGKITIPPASISGNKYPENNAKTKELIIEVKK